jgi:flagellar hook-associated protein 2
MSVGGIQFGGLASGLDTQAIISALLAVERRPIAQLETRKSTIERQRTLFGDFRNLLNNLEEKAQEVRESTSFLAYRASTDNDDQYFSASAGSNATPGSYEIAVRSLATNEIRASAGQADRDQTTFGSGNLTLTVDGQTKFISIQGGPDGNNTLDGIAQAINDADAGVTAQVVDTGQAGNPFQLVLTSEKAGSSGAISIGTDSATTELQSLASSIDANVIRQGTNASFTFNGIEIERSTNTITDLIQGVTIELGGASELDGNGDPIDSTVLTVATDSEATGEKIQDLVNAYNAVVDFVAGQFVPPPEDGDAAPLFGDSTLRSIRSSLRGLVGGSVATGNDAYSLLTQVGVTSDRDGRLSFNTERFADALTTDEQAVVNLFTAEGVGIADRLTTTLESYTDTVDGLIKARTDGFDRLIADANSQIERQTQRLDRYEQQLTTRFANLETLLSRLQSQGGALNSIPSF